MLQFRFVEFIPDKIDEGMLYISTTFCTAIHKCVCGCGNDVVTPLSPTDWKLTFDGKSVSLYPSIGNWSFECQSHYFISKNEIQYAKRWDKKRVDTGRILDLINKEKYYQDKEAQEPYEVYQPVETNQEVKTSVWQSIKKLFHLNF